MIMLTKQVAEDICHQCQLCKESDGDRHMGDERQAVVLCFADRLFRGQSGRTSSN